MMDKMMSGALRENNKYSHWQPIITSTPVKSNTSKKSNKINTQNVVLNPSEMLKNCLLDNYQKSVLHKQITKQRNKKSKALSYFDTSSSSEDENFSNSNRNINLKINSSSQKKIRDTEKSKHSEQSIISSEINNGKNKKDHKLNNSSFKDENTSLSKLKINQSQRKVNISQMSYSTSKLKKNNRDKKKMDKSGVIISKRLSKPKSRKNKTISHKMEEKNSSIEQSKSRCQKITRSVKKICSPMYNVTSNKPSKEKALILKDAFNDVNSFKGSTNPNKNIEIPLKKKSKKVEVDAVPRKKVKLKHNPTENLQDEECILNFVNNSTGSNSKNLSHQLFSNFKEQELLNSLDMTSMDTSEKQQQINSIVKDKGEEDNHLSNAFEKEMKKPEKTTPLKTIKINKNKKDSVLIKKKDMQTSVSKKSKQSIKKFKQKMADDKSHQSNSANINKYCSELIIPSVIPESQNSDNIPLNIKILGNPSCDKLPQVVNVPDQISKENTNEKESINKLTNTQNNSCFIKQKSSNSIKKGGKKLEGEMDSNQKCQVKCKKTEICCEKKGENFSNSSNSSVSEIFKQLNTISNFNESKPGFLVAECWSLKTFKCGIMKVSSECQYSSRTMHKYCYFGGIVIKGTLKMKIGDNNLQLQKGDMAFAPPLTDWLVQNNNDDEAIMYYWCIRSKI